MMSSVPADSITAARMLEWPALIRHETRAVLLGEFFETPPYRRRPRAFREVQRSAAERREAGAEDHARIEQIGIRHHALAQAGHGLVEVTEQQAIGDVRRRFVTLGGFHQHRLVILVDVKSFAALLALFAGRHQLAQALRYGSALQLLSEQLGHRLRHADGADIA